MGILDNLVGGAFGAATSLLTSKWNIDQANEQNRITREREDNAVQRRAKDMEAAGFNPVLAAGNPAGAQALSLPKAEDPGEAAMAAARGNQDIATSAAEQVRVGEQVKQIKAQTRAMKAEADMKEYDRDVQRAAGDPEQVANVVTTPEGSWDIEPATKVKRAQMRQALAEATGQDLKNLLTGAQTSEATASGGLKKLDLDTLKSLGGGAAANAGLQVLLSLLRMLK